MKPFSQQIFLDYEIRSSWWASYMPWRQLQKLAGRYYAFKVRRKYARYKESIEQFNLLYPEIVSVSIIRNGVRYTLPKPYRHHDVIHIIPADELPNDEVQGFVDARGNFLNRLEAMERAKKTKQLKRRTGAQYYQGPELFSEDLW